MRFLSGFESTHIFGTKKDVLELTKHTEFFEHDLRLVNNCGINLLRYSAPWHSIERTKGVYDWSWLDKALNYIQRLGIEPILDPLHHTSFPDWLIGGFANPEFVDSYVRFVAALAERYPWIRHYSVVNEPFVTTWFCGKEGVWYPFRKGNRNFVEMILNVGEAITRASRMLVETIPNVELIHVDASEQHRALDKKSEAFAEFMSEMRFLVPDLILGNITETHPLYRYLLRNGATEKRLGWFTENPARIDVIGLDYYSHSELEWNVKGRVYPSLYPEGFVSIAMDYVNRFNLPVMLTETNIRGYISDRISWLKFMVEQSETLEKMLAPRGISFKGFCWYPFIDSTDWCSLVTQANCNIDPQGIYWLDCANKYRNASELSEIFEALVRGQITSKDIPAYSFQGTLKKSLRNFMPMMEHWDWREPFAQTKRINKRVVETARGLAKVGW